MLLIARELLDFVRVAIALQRETSCSMEQARGMAAQRLMVDPPNVDDFNRALAVPIRRRGRGRVKDGALTKGEAVAAVAVYFESIGAAREQAINAAKRWLGVSVSRRVAKSSVEIFKGNTANDQYKPQADFAYAMYGQSAVPLPVSLQKARKRRSRNISDLG